MHIICISHVLSCKLWFCWPSQPPKPEWLGFSLKSDIISWKNWLQVKCWQQSSGVGAERPSASAGFHRPLSMWNRKSSDFGVLVPQWHPATHLINHMINLDPYPHHPNFKGLGWRRMSNPSEVGWIWYERLLFWSQFGIGMSWFTCNVVKTHWVETTCHTLGWDVSEQTQF